VPPLDHIVFGGDGVTVRMAPVWRSYYTPILILLMVGIVQNAINMVRPHWIRLRTATRVLTDAGFVTIMYLVLRTRELVIIADAAGNPEAYADKAALLSRILTYCLAVSAAVFAVDLILNVWRIAGRPGANVPKPRDTPAKS
jgi:DMSO reductase anchor subunit